MTIINRGVNKSDVASVRASIGNTHQAADVFAQLTYCGKWLDHLFQNLPPFSRDIPPDVMNMARNNLILNPGVNMAVVENVDDLILTAYVTQGHLPEAPELLICSSSTSWEEVNCHLLRWQGAFTNGRGDRLYCLAKADQLSDSIQRKTSSAMMQIERFSTAKGFASDGGGIGKFLCINTTDKGSLCSDFNHRRLRSYTPPELESDDAGDFSLRRIGEIISKTFVGDVIVYSGNRSGCGKSFAIHAAAGGTVNSWPVHKQVTISDYAAVVEADISHPLHIDISSSAHASLNDFLFSMIVVGSVSDSEALVEHVWETKQNVFYIEVASLALFEKLRMLNIFPQQVLNIDKMNVRPAILTSGMGALDFKSTRYDGTEPLTSRNAANASVRVQYVCKVLARLNAGVDVGAKEDGFLGQADLTPEFCFELLCRWGQQGAFPSLISMWSFVNVIYFQLKTMHGAGSIFTRLLSNSMLTDRYPGLKNDLIKFMIHTALDFAPRAPPGGDGDASGIVQWNDSNHNFLLQQHAGSGGFTLLARDQDKLFATMGGNVKAFLIDNKLAQTVGESGHMLSEFVKILSKTTGIQKTDAEVMKLGGGRFCVTYDTILKMIAIFTRIRCGIPVVLMGECGCGKTALLNYMSDYLDIPLVNLDIHGGTTAADIVAALVAAEAMDREVYVFLDEINTCSEMGLLTEIIVKRSVNGRKISEKLSIVAALNPYRLKPESMRNAGGLVFQLHTGGDVTPDPMADLVYKVHPVPGTLLEYCFEYGSLSKSIEQLYVDSMIGRCIPQASEGSRTFYMQLLSTAQTFLRDTTGETSVVSLRDVQRAIDLLSWFSKTGNLKELVEQSLAVSTAFTSDAVNSNTQGAAATSFVDYLSKQPATSTEGVLYGHIGAAFPPNIDQSTDEGVVVAHLKSVQTSPRFITVAMDCFHAWAGVKTGLSTNFVACRAFLSVDVDVTVNGAYNAQGCACKVRVVQSDDGKTEAQSETFSVTWDPETLNAGEEKVVNKLERVAVSSPYVKVEVIEVGMGDSGGQIHVKTSCDQTVRNVRVEDATGFIANRVVVLALAHVYYYRLDTDVDRAGLTVAIQQAATINSSGSTENRTDFSKPGYFENVLDQEQASYMDHMEIEEGIARNKALKENIFVVLTCILNHIPVMVVGKPGTSKTLCMQLILENLRGNGSRNAFWKQYPSITVFPYQCSPLSTAASIQKQFDAAESFERRQGAGSIVVLLLDEIGLAEYSPDMPLKVLHAMLMSKTVAIVGISNWMLDPAKMNRAVCLRRPDLPRADLTLTGRAIVGEGVGGEAMAVKAEPMADAYHDIYTNQPGRDYLGMRDYYSLLKFLGREIRHSGATFDDALLERALCRNFNGKQSTTTRALKLFSAACQTASPMQALPVVQMIEENLRDRESRHLMVLTQNSAAWSILRTLHLVDPQKTVLLVGSEFPEDASELQLIQQLNAVKRAMATGSTLVLLNHDNMYEALYDVLNQRYVTERTKSGVETRMLRVAVGMRSALCTVHDDFKLICIVEARHAYEKLDLPLLNRFEKQLLNATDVLTTSQSGLVDFLVEFVEACSTEANDMPLDEMFCGYDGQATLASLVLALKLDDNSISSQNTAIEALARVATPLAMISVSSLLLYKTEYFQGHGSFGDYCESVLGADGPLGVSKLKDAAGSIGLVLTFSPEQHLNGALADAKTRPGFDDVEMTSCVLNEFQSGDSFREKVRELHSVESTHVGPAVLVVQCDPIHVSQSHIRHAIAICEEETERRANLSKADISNPQLLEYFYESTDPTIQYALSQGRMPSFPRHVIFLVHLPPGMRSRRRHFPLDFLLAGSVFFLDDLRTSVYGSITPEEMLFKSVHELVESGKLDLWDRVKSLYGPALQRLRVPFPGSENALKRGVHLYPHRMKTLEILVNNSQFQTNVVALMKQLFERSEFRQKPPLQHSIAISGRVAGSLRERCSVALDEIILQLFALILARMERNFGLSTLARAVTEKSSAVQTLWWQVSDATSDSMNKLTPQDLLDSSRIEVKNDGVDQVFIARFPSSYAFIDFFDTEEFKESLLKTHGTGAEAEQKMRQILAAHYKAYFGEVVMGAITEFSKNKDHVDYLLDYITIRCPMFSGVSEETHLAAYAGVIDSFHSGSMRSLSAIHVAVWLNEKRLFHYCSMIEIATRFKLDNLKDQLMGALKSGGKPGILECDKRLLSVMLASLQELQDRMLIATESTELQLWPVVVDTMRVHIEATLRMLADGCEAAGLGNEASIIQQQWDGIRLIRLFLSEVIFPVTLKMEGAKVKNALQEFVVLAPSCLTYEYGFLDALCKCVVSVCANLSLDATFSTTIIASLLRRYLVEMAFGVSSKVPDKSSMEFATDLIKGKTTILPRRVQEQLSLRRSILYHLFESKTSNLTDASRKKVVMSLTRYAWSTVPSEETPDFTALELYAELKEYQIRNNLRPFVGCENPLRAAAMSQDRALVNMHSTDKKTLLPSLDTFAQVRVAVMNHARTLLGRLEAGHATVDLGESGLLQEVFHSPEGQQWRDYFLRAFYAEGRIGQLKVLLENKSTFTPWLKLASNAVSLSKRVENAFDPFGLLLIESHERKENGDLVNYQNMNFAVENALAARSGNEAVDFQRYVPDTMMNKHGVCAMMVSSVYTAAYTKYANEDPNEVYPRAAALEKHLLAVSQQHLQLPATDVISGFVTNFPMASGKTALLMRLRGDSMGDQLLKMQTISELFTVAWSNQNSFFWRCFASPETFVAEFMPTMPANEMKMIQQAKISDITKWYTCENGHPFSIGNCGMAMMTAKCHCGAKIGGSSHNLEHGRAADITQLAANDDPGYNKEFVQSPQSADIMRDSVGVFGVRVIRLFMHAMMQLACATGGTERVRQLIGYTDLDQTADFVADQFEKDWAACKENAEINNVDLALFLSAVLKSARENSGNVLGTSGDSSFGSSHKREKWERTFEDRCIKPLTSKGKIKQHIQSHLDEVTKHCPLDQKTVVMQMVGQEHFKSIEGILPQGPLSLEVQLMRYSLPITFDHFRKAFAMTPENATNYPTLALIINEVEEDLAIIKYLPAVLAWHGILFEAFGDGLAREDAMETTNDDAILRLPNRRHKEARRIFALFCEGFNKIFPTIDKIFECQDNPFMKMTMDETTPVTFSLPNQKALEGNCTIQLLSKLHKAHNDVLTSYAENLAGDAFHPSKNTETPPIDYRTPYTTARARVIEYSREANLLPLVLMYNTQSLEYTAGHDLGYDLARVEAVLTHDLLQNKSPITLLIRRFEYKGEMRKGNALTVLVQHLPQQELTNETREAIGAEIDTQYKTKLLLNFLEEAIEFIAAISHGGRDGVLPSTMMLVQYVTEVMFVQQDKFETMAPPTVIREVTIGHLQSLFFFLEENANGSFLDHILPQYRQELSPVQKDELRVAQPFLELSIVLNAMRELMSQSPGLLQEPGPGVDIELRDYLDYIDGVDESESYEEHFPHSLTIGTCLAAYQLLTNATVDLLETPTTTLGGGGPITSSGPGGLGGGTGGGGGGVAAAPTPPPSFTEATAGMSGASQILAFAQAQMSSTSGGGVTNYKQMVNNAPAAFQTVTDEYLDVYDASGGLAAAVARGNSSQSQGEEHGYNMVVEYL
jgi:hypothetical protein